MFPQPILRKVPEITALFWIVKLLTTALGESTSDFLVFHMNKFLAVFIGFCIFMVSMFIQFKTKKYNVWAYWFAVAMVAVFGTMAADGLHIQLHVPYAASTTAFFVALIIIFSLWHKSEKTLSIHTITTKRREVFYWLSVLATFALGTAAGDLMATTIGLGYFKAGLIFSAMLLIPAIIFFITRKNEVLWFWTAYVLTRPVGASFADWFGKSKSVGALGYGDGHVAIVLFVIIFILVAYLAFSRIDIKYRRR